MEFLRKNRVLLIAGILIATVSFSVGRSEGQESSPRAAIGLENQTEGQPANVDFSPFWKAWNTLNEKYVPASTTLAEVDTETRVWGAIEGLAASLGDPYTVFFPPVEAELFESDIRGNFEGVGMEIVAQGGAITVIAPLKGSPAESAGIQAGDRIIRVGERETSGLSTEEAVQIIRGPKGTQIEFTVVRENRREPFEVTVVRDIIDIPTINTDILQEGVFRIDLYSFTANSPNLFRGALREFIESANNKLILDLRGNPGGYLEAAIDMASWFLPSGKVIARENFGEGREEKVYRSKGYDIFNDNLRFVILVDGGSASASEILAGALSEHGKAILVGEQTFGKGSVQELINITSDTSLKVTVARWLTPDGNSISNKGITPDVVVERTATDVEAGLDPQLERAVEILNQ